MGSQALAWLKALFGINPNAACLVVLMVCITVIVVVRYAAGIATQIVANATVVRYKDAEVILRDPKPVK